MKSERQRNIESKLGTTIDKDLQQFREAEERERKRLEKERAKIEELENSNTYEAMKTIKKCMDEYFLDGILGLIGVGDWLVLFLGLPTIYFSLVKLHSIRLTVICFNNFIIDLLIGVIPGLGDILDFFYRGYKKNFDLINGYIHRDPETMQKINRDFWGSVLFSMVIIAILGSLVWLVFKLFSGIFSGFLSLFA